MLYLNSTYLDKENFKKNIRHAMDQLLFCGAESEVLGEAIYNDFYYTLISQINYNIQMIKSDLESGDTYNRISSAETRFINDLYTIKIVVDRIEQNYINSINQLTSEINFLKTEIEKLKKKRTIKSIFQDFVEKLVDKSSKVS